MSLFHTIHNILNNEGCNHSGQKHTSSDGISHNAVVPEDAIGCVSIQGMHSKTDYVTAARHGCPIPKAPSNVAEKCSLLFVKDPPAGSFTAQRIPRFIARRIFFRNGAERVEAAATANTYLMTKLCK